MTAWIKRHTSMRGRLALLLVLLLVLPLIAVGWLRYSGIAALQDADGESSSVAEISAKFRTDEAARGLRRCLDDSLASFALRIAHLPDADHARVAAAFADLPPTLHPDCVALLDAAGVSRPSMPPAWLEALAPHTRGGGPLAGYLVLPPGGPEGEPPREASLYQVALEPLAGGAVLVALRDVADDAGDGLLATLPFGAAFSRSITLRDARVLASHSASRAGPASTDGPEGAAALLQGGLWQTVLARGADAGEPQGDGATGAFALRDLRGEWVGLAVVQADDHEVIAARARSAALVSEVGRLVSLIALVGVALALVIGWTAPRWVWSDIRDTTATIFGSVDRLRELVRRNSRAIDEQSRLIQSVMAAVGSLESASQSIADTSRELAHSAEQSAWVSQSGNQRAEVSQRAVLDVRDKVEDITSQMGELERRCAAIGSLLGFIDQISNETNTLSINATIQAVGAGGSGREFSVVAGEIRKLADLALDSTQDIKRLIAEIQDSSRTTLGASQEGCKEVDKCLASFEELESAFARILRWVEVTTQSAHGIETSTARQSEALQSVAQSVEALEERARETEGNFHDVVSAADELAELGAQMNETWRVG